MHNCWGQMSFLSPTSAKDIHCTNSCFLQPTTGSWAKGLISEMTYYVSSGTLNSTSTNLTQLREGTSMKPFTSAFRDSDVSTLQLVTLKRNLNSSKMQSLNFQIWTVCYDWFASCYSIVICHVVYGVLKSRLKILILIMLCLVNISLYCMCFRGFNLCFLSICLGLFVFNSFV